LHDVTFLKRSFLFVKGKYNAALNVDTIREMVMWKTKQVTDQEAMFQTTRHAGFEAYLHGENFFLDFAKKVNDRLAELQLSTGVLTFFEYQQFEKRFLNTTLDEKDLLSSLICTEASVCEYFKGKKCVLSNFYPCPIKMYGRYFATTESAYQYLKARFNGSPEWLVEKIVACADGLEAKRLSHKIKVYPRWEVMKTEAMQVILDQKLLHCIDYQRFLKEHNGQYIENTDNEFWGRGAKGYGLNTLGKMHMEMRDFYKSFNFSFSAQMLDVIRKRYWEYNHKYNLEV
jgi:ribA/ribD-fused uncharacterized protein